MMPHTAFTRLRENYPAPLVFASVVGSRAFGTATDLSDYDVHGCHLLPLEHMLGLDSRSGETIEYKKEDQIDASTHDLKKFITLLLKGNGSVLEDLYSPLILSTSSLHEELRKLGKSCITRMCALHYKGMANNQQRNMQVNDVKKLLHIYRCLLQGIHLMRTGLLELAIPALAVEYQQPQVLEVIEYKKSGFEGLDTKELATHALLIDALYKRLEIETEQSHLPERVNMDARRALEALLIQARLRAI